jgi:starch phosphorylase
MGTTEPRPLGIARNPWAVLQSVSPRRVEVLLAGAEYRQRVADLLAHRTQYLASPTWFQQAHARSPLTRVAYFSMEYARSAALSIHSGGLGNVAGDQLKAASDLGVPVIGVGILYQQGYFRQVVTADGTQQALYPCNDPHQLPITPLRDASGDLLRLPVQLPGYTVWPRAWQVRSVRRSMWAIRAPAR